MLVVIGRLSNRTQSRDKFFRRVGTITRAHIVRASSHTVKSMPSSATSHPAFSISRRSSRIFIENRIRIVDVSVDFPDSKDRRAARDCRRFPKWAHAPSPTRSAVRAPRSSISSSDQKLPSNSRQSQSAAAAINFSSICFDRRNIEDRRPRRADREFVCRQPLRRGRQAAFSHK